MRSLFLILFISASLIGADAVPADDDNGIVPKEITAEESAKMIAELKAKKATKAAAKDPLTAAPDSAKRDSEMKKYLAHKDAKAQDEKLAGLKRRADDNERKAITFAKKAVANHRQFMTRARAEKKGWSDHDIYRDKVVLHESGGTNQAVLEDVEKATEFLIKANEARLAAGLEPIEMTVDRRGKPVDVIDWIIEKGR
jgi:hypothetical protein